MSKKYLNITMTNKKPLLLLLYRSLSLALISGAFCASISRADDLTFNGFITNTITQTNHPTPYIDSKQYSDDIDYQSGTVLGIQLFKQLDAKVSVQTQLFGRGVESANDSPFTPVFDTLFIDYKLRPRLNIKVGRFTPNTYLISKHLEVGSSYLWARPPVEVYETSYSFLSKVNGIEISYQRNLGSFNLRMQPYMGRINEKLISRTTGTLATIDTENLLGGGLELENDWLRLHVSALQIDASMVDGDGSLMHMPEVKLFSAGLQTEWSDWLLLAEFANVDLGQPLFDFSLSSQPAVSALGKRNVSIPAQTGYYTTLAYQFERFTPYLTLAKTDASYSEDANALINMLINQFRQEQRSVSIGTRLDATPSFAIKAEYHLAEALEASRGLFTTRPSEGNDIKLWTLSFNALF